MMSTEAPDKSKPISVTTPGTSDLSQYIAVAVIVFTLAVLFIPICRGIAAHWHGNQCQHRLKNLGLAVQNTELMTVTGTRISETDINPQNDSLRGKKIVGGSGD